MRTFSERRWKRTGAALICLALALSTYCWFRGLGFELSHLTLTAGLWFMWEEERAGRSAEQTNPRGSRD